MSLWSRWRNRKKRPASLVGYAQPVGDDDTVMNSLLQQMVDLATTPAEVKEQIHHPPHTPANDHHHHHTAPAHHDTSYSHHDSGSSYSHHDGGSFSGGSDSGGHHH